LLLHALEELVEDRFHALLVVVAAAGAGLEHVAEQVVIGRARPPARIGARGNLRLRRRARGGLGLPLAAAQHLLEDAAERVVAIGALRSLRRGPRLPAAAEHALEDLAEGVVERARLRRFLPRLRLAEAAALLHHLLDDLL